MKQLGGWIVILCFLATLCLVARTLYRATSIKKEPVIKYEIPIFYEPFERKCRTFTFDKRFHM